MVLVVTRERSYAVWTKEFVLIEHIFENALQFLLGQNGKQAAFFVADKATVSGSNVVQKLRMTPAEQFNQFREPLQAGGILFFQYRRCAEGKQPNHRSYFQPDRIAVGKPEEVVEKSIFAVPHLIVADSNAIHGVGNPHEVLQEPVRHLFVTWILSN